MTVWIVICLASLVILAIRLRNRGCSLGMPIAYLLLLDLNHVPGTLASQFSGVILYNSDETSIGIYFTSIGAVAFVVGAWIGNLGGTTASRTRREDDVFFRLFCLTGGAVLVTALSLIPTIPTLTAALYYGADIWLLPVILGLLASVRQAELRRSLYWIGSLFVYPLWGLLTGGFLSYGATTVAIGLAPIVMVARSSLKLTIGSVLALFLGLTVFVNYFAGRDNIRKAVWHDAPMIDRIDAVGATFADFSWFDPSDPVQIVALDSRLNQNYFVGLAAERLDTGQVNYLYGHSLTDALIALVPRALWPDKPVYGGSPAIVTEMTGLDLSTTTSWGVGNVMEFYINFGIPGLVGGFLALGWLLGKLDRKAADAVARGDQGQLILFFLPAAALIQPIGSLVEIVGGAGAALGSAYAWKALLRHGRGKRARVPLQGVYVQRN